MAENISTKLEYGVLINVSTPENALRAARMGSFACWIMAAVLSIWSVVLISNPIAVLGPGSQGAAFFQPQIFDVPDRVLMTFFCIYATFIVSLLLLAWRIWRGGAVVSALLAIAIYILGIVDGEFLIGGLVGFTGMTIVALMLINGFRGSQALKSLKPAPDVDKTF